MPRSTPYFAFALCAAWLAHATPAGAAGRPMGSPATGPSAFTAEGELALEAHFRHPGDVRRYHSRELWRRDGRGRARLDWTTWEDGDTVLVPESFLLASGIVYHRDAPGAAWVRLTGNADAQARLRLAAARPWEFAPANARAGARASSAALVLERRGNRTRAVRTRPGERRPAAVEELRAHPRLGDVSDRIEWTYGAGAWPESIRVAIVERDQSWSLVEHRVALSFAPLPDSLFTAPDSAAVRPEEPDTLAHEPIAFTPLGAGLWGVEQPDVDSRSLVIERDDGLAVLESAISSANGERLLDALAERFPNRPVRWFAFSHYHPSYAGGLRAFVAAGATIVTTSGNADFVRAMVARPWTVAPDRLARSPRPLRLQAFSGRLELPDAAHPLVLTDLGARSNHTDEFVVFQLPRDGVIFETEQGWADAGGGRVRASRRAKTFLAALEELHLDGDRLVQSWPMRNLPPEMPRARLRELASATAR